MEVWTKKLNREYIGMASKMIGVIEGTVLGKKELSKGTKLRVVNAMVILTQVYDCEAWNCKKGMVRSAGSTDDEGV